MITLALVLVPPSVREREIFQRACPVSLLSATVGWFSSLTIGCCAVYGSTPQQHIYLLSARGVESWFVWLMRAEIDCNRLPRRRDLPLSLGFFFSRSLAGACSGLLTLSVGFFLSGSLWRTGWLARSGSFLRALFLACWLACSLGFFLARSLAGARAGLLGRVLSCALSRWRAGWLARSCLLALAVWLARSRAG